MSSFRLRPACYSDVPCIAKVYSEIFKDDALFGDIMHPNRQEHPDGLELWFLRSTRVNFWDYTGTWLVVVYGIDGKETVVGAAHWDRMGNGGGERDLGWYDPRKSTKCPRIGITTAKVTQCRVDYYRSTSLHRRHLGKLLMPLSSAAMKVHALIWPNRACDPAQVDVLSKSLPFVSHYWSGKRAECWNLEAMGVLPLYQGRGIGKMFARWGLERADQEGVCASVVVAPGKDGFYQKCGFEVHEGNYGEGEGNPLAGGDGGNIWWRLPRPRHNVHDSQFAPGSPDSAGK